MGCLLWYVYFKHILLPLAWSRLPVPTRHVTLATVRERCKERGRAI
jgi:hypothetical protein